MTTATLTDPQPAFAVGVSTTLSPPAGLLESSKRLDSRLDELTSLTGNWDGEGAQSVDRAALRLAGAVITQALRAGLPEPEIFPVPDGGVQIEWQAGPVELELEIEAGGRVGVFVCDDKQATQQIDGQIPEDLSRFALALARLNAYA